MLYVLGFERIGVVAGDLYFVDPYPGKNQEGAERGVRLELRMLEPGALRGSIYSATPIEVEQPLWRLDLLETVDGAPGTFDRTHHHPRFEGWEPGTRRYVRELSADPMGWLEDRLGDVGGLLDDAGVDRSEVPDGDIAAIAEAAPEIVRQIEEMLEKVRAGELARPVAPVPMGGAGAAMGARSGWL